MGVAVVVTLLVPHVHHGLLILLGVVLGVAIGLPAARRVKMTEMPQMVALFNGVGGGAVALIAWVEFRSSGGFAEVATYVAIFSTFAAIVGSISFWGSLVAFGKLQGLVSGNPVTVGRMQLPLSAAVAGLSIACATASVAGAQSEPLIVGLLLSAGVLGLLLVLPIGGADMPVVISLLNAFTGLSAAATGVALNNPALIVAGMIVGASGTMLTQQMAAAMNRTIPSIIAGGFGGDAVAPTGDGTAHPVRSTSAADVAIQLAYANQVVIVPGYGLAVSQAQHAVREMTKLLEAGGVTVKYAVHPVAGRMPGHMNVLLAEAEVPYDQLTEMDVINPEFARTDVALVVGANDVVNPDARTNRASPLFGMPILDVDHANSIIVLKRSMRSGYAGVENPLFSDPKTELLFGDAKASITAITAELKPLLTVPARSRPSPPSVQPPLGSVSPPPSPLHLRRIGGMAADPDDREHRRRPLLGMDGRRPLRARPEQGMDRIVCVSAGQARDDVLREAAHLRLGMSGVCGESRLPHGRSHDPCPVADGDGSQPAVVQHGEVAWAALDAIGVQGSEALGDGGACELQRRPVVGESRRVGPTAVQPGRHRGDEHCVIGQPAIHIGDALDWQPARGQGVRYGGETRTVARFDRRWLLRDREIRDDVVAHRAADTGEAERDVRA